MTNTLTSQAEGGQEWKPHVTVAAIIERNDRFLMIEESCNGRVVINQPAGHLEEGESLQEAVIRETLEETAWSVRPTAITGIYQWVTPHSQKTYLRVCFIAECLEQHQRLLDKDILQVMWLSRDKIAQCSDQLRSPMVMQCIDDYLAGKCYPLTLVNHIS